MALKAKKKSSKSVAPILLPAIIDADARPPRKVNDNLPRDANGKPLNKVERDENAEKNPRQAVLTAFGKVGGVRWLVKYAKRDPKGFAGLLAKAMPTEVNLSGTVGYAPLPIPVEMREPIPGEFTVIQETVTQVTQELDPFT